MQTIEEYKAYTQQLEGEVKKWHCAYDALVIERNQLVSRIKELEARKAKGEKATAELVKAYEQLILSKVRIKELESQLKQNQGEKQDENPIP